MVSRLSELSIDNQEKAAKQTSLLAVESFHGKIRESLLKYIEKKGAPESQLASFRSILETTESPRLIDLLSICHAIRIDLADVLREAGGEISSLHPDLPDQQRDVLQAIVELPNDLFEQAKILIATLDGQPMTEAFVNSFKNVLRAKGWGVECENCQKPSVLVWVAGGRYAEGGRAKFSHTGPAPHGSMTSIKKFEFVKKADRRKTSIDDEDILQEDNSAKSSLLSSDLSEQYQSVLQTIIDLPDDAFAQAETLLATVNGQPMTEAFTNSFKNILRAKKWGVVCETCGKPSVILWHAGTGYAEGGRAHFSHSSPSPHGSMTIIPKFTLVKKPDLRRKDSTKS